MTDGVKLFRKHNRNVSKINLKSKSNFGLLLKEDVILKK